MHTPSTPKLLCLASLLLAGALSAAQEPEHYLLMQGESLNSVLNHEFGTQNDSWEPFFGLSGDSTACLGQSPDEFCPTHNGCPCPLGPWLMVQPPHEQQPILCCIGRTGSIHSCLLYSFRQDAHGTWRVSDVTAVSSFQSSYRAFEDWQVTACWSDLPAYLKYSPM